MTKATSSMTTAFPMLVEEAVPVSLFVSGDPENSGELAQVSQTAEANARGARRGTRRVR